MNKAKIWIVSSLSFLWCAVIFHAKVALKVQYLLLAAACCTHSCIMLTSELASREAAEQGYCTTADFSLSLSA